MLKVLIVEDEETIRRGIALTIDWGSLNCTVVAEAANGEEGLAAAQRYQPNLIITDIKMPKMDGLEMVRRLRQMGNGAFVIILTAFDTFEYAQNAIRLGAVDYILKPFHDGDLERAVQAVQGRYAGEKAVPSPPESGLKKGDRSKYVQGAVSYVDAHFDDPALSISAIAADLGISEGYLSHTFKKETGSTILSYLTRVRIRRAMALLRDCRVKVYEVAEQVGYRDIAYFSATFKKMVGVSPSEYQDTCPGKELL